VTLRPAEKYAVVIVIRPARCSMERRSGTENARNALQMLAFLVFGLREQTV
jgi:hypothetical protein